jgi:hypothetical protein
MLSTELKKGGLGRGERCDENERGNVGQHFHGSLQCLGHAAANPGCSTCVSNCQFARDDTLVANGSLSKLRRNFCNMRCGYAGCGVIRLYKHCTISRRFSRGAARPDRKRGEILVEKQIACQTSVMLCRSTFWRRHESERVDVNEQLGAPRTATRSCVFSLSTWRLDVLDKRSQVDYQYRSESRRLELHGNGAPQSLAFSTAQTLRGNSLVSPRATGPSVPQSLRPSELRIE